ncbi:MAG TPA: hypothetical protein VFZ65_08735, partial [Planctomycetota bacterium]|nr:hypothetical protein [Planctomycetota bacterium]
MRNHSLFVLLTIAPCAIGQAAPARVQPIGMAQVMSRATGLQAHPNEDGLIGFGAGYFARFRDHEVRYDVTQERGATPAFVTLSAPAVTRDGVAVAIHAGVAPVTNDRRATYGRATGIDERYDVGPDGIELSWTFAERPPGEVDLVVRYAVETSLGAPVSDAGGLKFDNGSCGVTIGRVTGVDHTGASVAGAVQWDGTGVRLSLPAAFVDSAAYPIVLDPALGSTIAVAPLAPLTVSDACYDATTDRWLVAWSQTAAGPNNDMILAQLVANASGALVGNAIVVVVANTISEPPRVANHGLRDEFAVAYISDFNSVEVVRVSAITGAVLGSTTVATTTGLDFLYDVNIGALVEPPIGSDSGFTVLYFDFTGSGAIKANRLTYLPSGSLQVGPSVPIWTNSSAAAFSSPRMSRAAGADGKLLAVAVRFNGSNSIVTGLLDAGSVNPGITGVLDSNLPTGGLATVDVDGYAGRWVVAYDAPGPNLVSGPGVRVRPVALTNTGNSFVVGAAFSFGGFPTNQASYPSVAYALGRAWLGYYSLGSTLGGAVANRRVVALDSTSCTTCGDTFSVLFANSSPSTSLIRNRCLATTTSGGKPNGEEALFVWADPSLVVSSTALIAQRLRDFGTVGTTANLGGGCGTTGTLAFNHPPGIGSSGFRCTLSGLPPTALLPIFNFSPPTSTFPCGACVWTPFSVTLTPPILGGAAFVEFPIPC